MMKLYNNPQSRGLTLLPLLKELQIEDQIEQVEVAYEHMHQQAYTQMNPMGKVPCLVDQGVICCRKGLNSSNGGKIFAEIAKIKQ